MISRVSRSTGLRAFARDERGQFAIIGALLMVPILAIAGLALDYARLHAAQSRLQAAADAAAMAAVGAAGAPAETLERIAADFVAANADGMEVETSTKVDGRRLEVEVKTEVATPLLSVIGTNVTEIRVAASVESPMPLGGGSVRQPVGLNGGADAATNAEYERLRQRIFKALNQLPRAERERLSRKYAEILKRKPARLAR
jgi:Flp pilus assembly protein TadG